jgi:4-oxalocrotonate tautomerase
MPHISVKMWPGRSEEQKRAMVDRIVDAIKETTGAPDDYITVSVEEISSSAWPKEVFKPEIADQADKLYKKPGYGYTKEEMGG